MKKNIPLKAHGFQNHVAGVQDFDFLVRNLDKTEHDLDISNFLLYR